MRRPSKREGLLLAILPALLLAAAWSDSKERDAAGPAASVAPARKRAADSRPEAPVPDLNLALLHRPSQEGEPANAFESRSWAPPPPPPPPPVAAVKPGPPPPPKAPPLPFTYLGQYKDADKPIYFLVRGDSIFTVKEGDVLAGTYRVEGISGNRLELTYLPLKIRQGLDIGAG